MKVVCKSCSECAKTFPAFPAFTSWCARVITEGLLGGAFISFTCRFLMAQYDTGGPRCSLIS